MSEINLADTAHRLAVGYESNPEFFRQWLEGGIRSIEMDDVDPRLAFDPGKFDIGSNAEHWLDDIAAVYEKLPSRLAQSNFNDGLAHAVARLDPKEGPDVERVAIRYLELARLTRAPGVVLDQLRPLIQGKFRDSQLLFDHALLTWRNLADIDAANKGGWERVFCDPNDPRSRMQNAPIVAIGLVLANPRLAEQVFVRWEPFNIFINALATGDYANHHAKKLVDSVENLVPNGFFDKFPGCAIAILREQINRISPDTEGEVTEVRDAFKATCDLFSRLTRSASRNERPTGNVREFEALPT
jgi:hypothetical protein